YVVFLILPFYLSFLYLNIIGPSHDNSPPAPIKLVIIPVANFIIAILRSFLIKSCSDRFVSVFETLSVTILKSLMLLERDSDIALTLPFKDLTLSFKVSMLLVYWSKFLWSC